MLLISWRRIGNKIVKTIICIAISVASFLIARLIAEAVKSNYSLAVMAYSLFWGLIPLICLITALLIWYQPTVVIAIAGLLVVALHAPLFNAVAYVYLKGHGYLEKGSLIVTCGVEGKVLSHSIFKTTLETSDKSKIIIPNSKIAGDVLTIKNLR